MHPPIAFVNSTVPVCTLPLLEITNLKIEAAAEGVQLERFRKVPRIRISMF